MEVGLVLPLDRTVKKVEECKSNNETISSQMNYIGDVFEDFAENFQKVEELETTDVLDEKYVREINEVEGNVVLTKEQKLEKKQQLKAIHREEVLQRKTDARKLKIRNELIKTLFAGISPKERKVLENKLNQMNENLLYGNQDGVFDSFDLANLTRDKIRIAEVQKGSTQKGFVVSLISSLIATITGMASLLASVSESFAVTALGVFLTSPTITYALIALTAAGLGITTYSIIRLIRARKGNLSDANVKTEDAREYLELLIEELKILEEIISKYENDIKDIIDGKGEQVVSQEKYASEINKQILSSDKKVNKKQKMEQYYQIIKNNVIEEFKSNQRVNEINNAIAESLKIAQSQLNFDDELLDNGNESSSERQDVNLSDHQDEGSEGQQLENLTEERSY